MGDIDFDVLVEIFKTAWEKAHTAGEFGHRTQAGLAAVYEVIENQVRVLIDEDSVSILYDDEEPGRFLGVSAIEALLDQLAPEDGL